MGKIVKFCSECEEGFAEKFGFCPNCGSALEAFEMNPLHTETTNAVTNKAEAVQPDRPAFISSSDTVVEETATSDTHTFSDDDVLELDVEGDEPEKVFNQPETEPEIFAPAASYSSNGESGYNYQEFSNADVVEDEDDGYHVTVIQEKNVKQRNGLLLGMTVLMLVSVFGGFIYSLFAKELDLAAISGDEYIALINDFDPIPIEEEELPKDADSDSGGGGGGGREEETETQKGRFAPQMREKPIIQPDKTIVQKDFELKQPIATTQGNKKFEITEEQLGIPTSTNAFGSNGRGKGGGQGEGEGTGQGSGRGGGAGTGEGTGFGSGKGDGEGPGSGDGRNRRADRDNDPPPSGPSKPLNITYKPKPKYTDEARQKNITGNVKVKVTFLASGQIGSVSPITNLGYGLTEQAIAAARQMRFEPQLQNGRPVAVTKTVVFTFTIY